MFFTVFMLVSDLRIKNLKKYGECIFNVWIQICGKYILNRENRKTIGLVITRRFLTFREIIPKEVCITVHSNLNCSIPIPYCQAIGTRLVTPSILPSPDRFLDDLGLIRYRNRKRRAPAYETSRRASGKEARW